MKKTQFSLLLFTVLVFCFILSGCPMTKDVTPNQPPDPTCTQYSDVSISKMSDPAEVLSLAGQCVKATGALMEADPNEAFKPLTEKYTIFDLIGIGAVAKIGVSKEKVAELKKLLDTPDAKVVVYFGKPLLNTGEKAVWGVQEVIIQK